MVKRTDLETMKLLSDKIRFIQNKYSPVKIILFGSRARGDHFKDSDIDLLVISEKFKGIDWRERIIGIFGNWNKKQMLEPVCLTPEEFERKKKQIGIVQQAVKEGIEIKTS